MLRKTFAVLTIVFIMSLTILSNVANADDYDYYSLPPNWQSRSGVIRIYFPDASDPWDSSPFPIDVNCTIFSANFTQGEQAIIKFRLTIPDFYTYFLDVKIRPGFEITVKNALIGDSTEPFMATVMVEKYCENNVYYPNKTITDANISQYLAYQWSSADRIVFQDSGQINLTINAPNVWAVDGLYILNSKYNSNGYLNYSTTVTVPNITISPYSQTSSPTPTPTPTPSPTSTTGLNEPIIGLTDGVIVIVLVIGFTVLIFFLVLYIHFLERKTQNDMFNLIARDYVIGTSLEALGIGGLLYYYLVNYKFNSPITIILIAVAVILGLAIGITIVAFMIRSKNRLFAWGRIFFNKFGNKNSTSTDQDPKNKKEKPPQPEQDKRPKNTDSKTPPKK